MNPLISVIIPLYNKEDLIVRTINSILKQSYANFELIIVNDGSTDNSLQAVNAVDDSRIKVFTKENGGVSLARNFGVNKATSNWIFFLDADDELYENGLLIFKNLIVDFPKHNFFTANFVAKYSNGIEVTCCKRKKRGIVKRKYKSVWRRGTFPRMGSMLIKKESFIKVGGFKKECIIWEDLKLVVDLFKHEELIYDPTPVFVHNLDANELSQKLKPIENEYAYYIDMQLAENFYHKLIFLELLERTKKKRLALNEKEVADLMTEKIGSNEPLLFIGKVERFILKHIGFY